MRPKAAKFYRQQADRGRLADGAQDRMAKVVSLRAAKKPVTGCERSL